MRLFIQALALAVAAAAIGSSTAIGGQQRDLPAALASTSGTAAIAGTVVVADTAPRPARRAVVQLTMSNTPGGWQAITDDQGRFEFANLPEGRYLLSASKASYVTVVYGASRPNRTGSAIVVSDGQRVANVVLRLLPGAAITGVVRDTNGQPVAGYSVIVLTKARAYMTGERTLVEATRGRSVTTDDRGVYRAFGLVPGDYTVAVAAEAGRDFHEVTDADLQRAADLIRQAGASGVAPGATAASAADASRPSTAGYATVYYGGTAAASEATVFTLAAGEERSGVDLQLQRVPMSRIEGTATGPDGQPMAGVSIRLFSNTPAPSTLMQLLSLSAMTTSDARGHFQLSGIAPGAYTVTARFMPRPGGGAPAPGAGPVSATRDVTVEGQDLTADLTLKGGFSVSGRIEFDRAATTTPPQDLSRARVTLTAVADRASGTVFGVPGATPDASGRFTFVGVTPGRYKLTASVPGGTTTSPTWIVQSASMGGAAALDEPVDLRGGGDVSDAVVTMTDRQTELSGLMLDRDGKPAPEYSIVAFSSNKTFWQPQSRFIQQVRPGRDGRFTFRNLPPGEYLLAAVVDVEQGEWFDRDFLDSIAGGAAKVSIAAGDKTTQDLRVR